MDKDTAQLIVNLMAMVDKLALTQPSQNDLVYQAFELNNEAEEHLEEHGWEIKND